MELLVQEKYVEGCVHNCIEGVRKRQSVDPVTGAVSWFEVECSCPLGTNTEPFGAVVEQYVDVTDVVDLLNDIKNKCNDIFQKVNE